MRIHALAALAALLTFASASPAAALTHLRLDRAAITYDPNQPIWHVSARLCNADQGPSGTVKYSLWLYQDASGQPGKKVNFFNLGGILFNNQLQPGKCWDKSDYRIKVNWAKLNPGEYHIELVIAEFDGSKYATRVQQPFLNDQNQYMDFVKN
jgi:hypothetical protein